MAPGAFFVLACLTAIQNVLKEKGAKAGKDVSKIQSGCSSDCMNCSDSGCAKRLVDVTEKVAAPEAEKKVETAEKKVVAEESAKADANTESAKEENVEKEEE